ncbi:hypothetical protein [Burkholderia ubonensis]|uniref:hypothetical protein n=1 Tax=Burkholderia ubonensis TaxID=101571 RepID=UPI0018E020C1|nr:hypothetical protein [Burkholderia ubonensis]
MRRPLSPGEAKFDTDIRFRLAQALSKSTLADDARYERLPAFVRFRATGAARAWEDWRRVVEQGPNNVSEMLRTRSIVALVNQFRELARRLLPYGTPEMMPDEGGKSRRAQCAVAGGRTPERGDFRTHPGIASTAR